VNLKIVSRTVDFSPVRLVKCKTYYLLRRAKMRVPPLQRSAADPVYYYGLLTDLGDHFESLWADEEGEDEDYDLRHAIASLSK
jgi:hypothetical protein